MGACRGAVGSVVDDTSGVLASPDPDAWVAAINEALERVDQWQDIGVGDLWRIENQVTLYERLYRDVLLAKADQHSAERSVDAV